MIHVLAAGSVDKEKGLVLQPSEQLEHEASVSGVVFTLYGGLSDARTVQRFVKRG